MAICNFTQPAPSRIAAAILAALPLLLRSVSCSEAADWSAQRRMLIAVTASHDQIVITSDVFPLEPQ